MRALGVVLLALVFVGFLTSSGKVAHAQVSLCSCENSQCMAVDCQLAKPPIREDHKKGEKEIIEFIQEEFNRYRDWITDWDTSPQCQQNINQKCRGVYPSFFRAYFLPEAMEMTEQMSAISHLQAFTTGSMLDAKTQLETQRDFHEKEFEAYKDYQPSQAYCAFGTNIRDAAHSEQRGKLNALALAERQLARHLGSASSGNNGVAGAAKLDDDREARWQQFRDHYCDPRDNNYQGQSTGLVLACGNEGDRANRDIDFTRVIEHERTLNVSFNGGTVPTNDEEDVLALSSNLYGHDVLTRNIDENFAANTTGSKELYLLLRSVVAKRSVAENSYNAIVGLKSAGTTDVGGIAPFLGAAIKDLGVETDAEIYRIIGSDPSFYAQLEILARKLYQSTDFYTNLYTSPTNIARKSTAMKAIELMLDRLIYESELRQELATSVLLSSRLQRRTYPDLRTLIVNTEGG